MNNPVKPRFPNNPVVFTVLSSTDIEEHCLDYISIREDELFHVLLTDLEARFRRTFKMGTQAPNKGYGYGEECFLW